MRIPDSQVTKREVAEAPFTVIDIFLPTSRLLLSGVNERKELANDISQAETQVGLPRLTAGLGLCGSV